MEVKISREVAHNSQSCQMELENAILTLDQARARNIVSEPTKTQTKSLSAGDGNGTFCASVDTWNRYNVNYVQGLSNGSIRYEWDHQKWGGCTILLSFHRVTGYWGADTNQRIRLRR